MTTDHPTQLGELADAYRKAKAELDQARERLTAAVRTAMTDGGMKQAEVLRATNHVWTREQIRQVTKSDAKSAGEG
jgi:hypothetical protein